MLFKTRTLFFYLVISVITVLFYFAAFLPFILFLKILAKLGVDEGRISSIRYRIAIVFSNIFIWITRIFVGLKYKVVGLEKLPSMPSLVVANHQSFWENMFMQLIIPEHSWIIKKELFDIPFFGWGLKAMNPVAVDRTQNSSINQIIEGGKQKFAKGNWMIMFPEATRLKPDQTARFKRSAAKLALEAKVPIVMIAHNAGLFWPKGFWLKKPGVITVKVIEVMQPEEIKKFELRELTDHIEKVINTEKGALLADESIGGYTSLCAS